MLTFLLLTSSPSHMMIVLLLTVLLTASPSESVASGRHKRSSFFTDNTVRSLDLSPRFSTSPLLYYSPNDVPTLRSRAESTHSHIAEELRNATVWLSQHPDRLPPEDYNEFRRTWNEVYGNNLPPLALNYVLSPDQGLLNRLILLLDRMVSYEKWYVSSSPTDEVPVAHHLVGFLTAVDMLYPYLEQHRREKYLAKAYNATHALYSGAQKHFWGKVYLQNHQSTNIVGLLIGSIVLDCHYNRSEIKKWKRFALKEYERSMKLLEGIPDGSLSEGVGYVGYTTRSLTQYVYLVKRHFGLDHSKHPWLRRHFDFIYLTILPGLKLTVGIADCPRTWFYGPESQLYFLDAFVLRDGRANWLAQRIKERKSAIMLEQRPSSQKYATLHTEFLFYDGNIKESPPEGYSTAQLKYFNDWGVVTYRSGSVLDRKSTFLSFKSSKIQGEYLNKLALSVRDSTLHGWRSFNPGHEHPDQNSFTFSLHGHLFVSEGLYAPKSPFLDNVLMFQAPGVKGDHLPACPAPWVGQLGSCEKWLYWLGPEEGRSHGRILTAQTDGGMVLVCGESSQAYPQVLGLRRAYRIVLLLQEDLLLVLDHIILDPGSPVRGVAAHFNNYEHKFEAAKHPSGLAGLRLKEIPGYRGFWVSSDGQSTPAQFTSHAYNPQIPVSNANVTFKVKQSSNTLGFIFLGPNINQKQFELTEESGHSSIFLHSDKWTYRINCTLVDIDNNHTDQTPCVVFDAQNNVIRHFRTQTQTKTSSQTPSEQDSHRTYRDAQFHNDVGTSEEVRDEPILPRLFKEANVPPETEASDAKNQEVTVSSSQGGSYRFCDFLCPVMCVSAVLIMYIRPAQAKRPSRRTVIGVFIFVMLGFVTYWTSLVGLTWA